MAKLTPRDGHLKTTDINSQSGVKTYRAGSDGRYDVTNPKHIKALKAEGFTEANLALYQSGDGERGYTCVECGFGSWFRKCSRCGHESSAPKTDGD